MEAGGSGTDVCVIQSRLQHAHSCRWHQSAVCQIPERADSSPSYLTTYLTTSIALDAVGDELT